MSCMNAKQQKNSFSCDKCHHLPTTEWGALSTHQLSTLSGNKTVINRKAGEAIFSQGQSCQGMFCIVNGTIGIQKQDQAANTTLLRIIDDGATIGHDAFFGTRIHDNTATCLTDVQLCFIPEKPLDGLLNRQPQLMTAFARRLASDLQHADQAQEKTIHLQVRARLACFLLSLRDRHGEVDDHGNLLISLPMSRREIASSIGTRPESLSRAIRNLHDTGTAKFMGKRVVVRDLDELLDEAERS